VLKALKPGGKLVLGNFDVSNPTIPIMETILDWKLIYRSEEQMKKLFAPLGGNITLEKEDTSVNLFCVITKDNS